MPVTIRWSLGFVILWGMLLPAFALKECPACRKSFDDGVNFCPFDGKTLKAKASQAHGPVEIVINPATASIAIDGLPRGGGPRLTLDLPVGEHRLEAVAPGYAPFRLSFSVVAGQPLRLSVELAPLAAPVDGTTPPRVPASPELNPTAALAARLDQAMVQIPAGTYLLGSDRGNPDERPLRRVKTAGFWIDVHEVTCAQYQRFLDDIRRMGHRHCHPAEPPNKDHTPFHTYAWALRFSWLGGRPPAKMEDHPVVLVDWFDAAAYAAWAGKRLPTEDEWEIAAGGGRGLDYPWGNNFSPDLCNVGDYPVRVGAFPGGASPWGVLDMAGNVAEWTATAYEPDARDGKLFGGRYGQPIIRGGSWDDESRGCRVSARDVHRSPFYRSTTVGFRCVSDVPPSALPSRLSSDLQNAPAVENGAPGAAASSTPAIAPAPSTTPGASGKPARAP